MTGDAPPIRFLLILLGGWALARGAILFGDRPAGDRPPSAMPLAGVAEALAPAEAQAATRDVRPAVTGAPIPAPSQARARIYSAAGQVLTAPAAQTGIAAAIPDSLPPQAGNVPQRAAIAMPVPPGLALPGAAGSRWSGSAWLLIRRDDAPALATAGQLGGSQAGGRFAYRLNDRADRPIAATLRVSSALSRPAGAEAALGIDWKPSAAPIHLLAERRQSLGGGGRSAFALLAYGGVYDRPLGAARVEAYAQVGIVGAASRDAFGDGAVRIGIPVDAGDRARIGGGIWGAAQPGVERLDIGPQISVRLPAGAAGFRLLADWRVRIAGDAAPRSGPALTLAADF